MCEIGDIILINSYESQGQCIGTHSFIVIDNKEGKIQGLDYNIICNVMSSFKNESHRAKKLSYPGNFRITSSDLNVINGNKKDGYIKSEQFYFFNTDKIDFTIIGSLKPDVFNRLIEFIENQSDLEIIIDNL